MEDKNKAEEEKILSGKGTDRFPLRHQILRLANSWDNFLIVKIGTKEIVEWKFMREKDQAEYLMEMLKEYL